MWGVPQKPFIADTPRKQIATWCVYTDPVAKLQVDDKGICALLPAEVVDSISESLTSTCSISGELKLFFFPLSDTKSSVNSCEVDYQTNQSAPHNCTKIIDLLKIG